MPVMLEVTGNAGFELHRQLKVAACRVLETVTVLFAGQFTAPANVQRGFALGQIQLAVPVFEGRAGELAEARVPLALEYRVLSAALKEVFEGGLLVAKALLQRHRADFAPKMPTRGLS